MKDNKANKLYRIIGSLLMVGLFILPAKVQATHIVGGELTYRCIANWTFEVTLTVRRDCEYGSPEAQFDKHASVGIYDSNGELLPWLGVGGQLLIPFTQDDTINSSLVANCDFIGDEVCVHRTVYTDTITLPFRPGGYILAYQRCCRNETLNNILDPISTGSIFSIRLTNTASIDCNNSPVFNNEPDIYICANEEFSADMSATDEDGDSLVYKLCTPLVGASRQFPMPQPARSFRPIEVDWANPFSLDNLLGGSPLTIDPRTGIITGAPDIVGQFLVGVCVEEYRDGELISTVRRDLQYNVRECIDGPEANFVLENEPQCDGLEVEFINTSEFTDTYEWFFDYPNTDPEYTSTEENPVFTYPANGIYTVKLIASRSSDGCFDELFKNIGVYDSKLEASFDSQVIECVGDSSLLVLTSTSVEPDSNQTITNFDWTITTGDSTVSLSGAEVSVIVPATTELDVTLIVTSSNGCTATATDFVDSTSPLIASFDYKIDSCIGDSTLIVLTNTSLEPDSNHTLTNFDWTVALGDTNVNLSGAEVSLVVPAITNLEVSLSITSSNGCSATVIDTIDSTSPLVASFDLEIDVCIEDSTVIKLTNTSINPFEGHEFVEINWEIFTDGFSATASGQEVNLTVPRIENLNVTLMITSSNGCTAMETITFDTDPVKLEFVANPMKICPGETLQLIANGNPDWTYTWDPEEGLVFDGDDKSNPTYTLPEGVSMTVYHVTVTDGKCEKSDSVVIMLNDTPPPSPFDFNAVLECGTFTVCFENTSEPLDGQYIFNFGDEGSEGNTSTENVVCHTFPDFGVYTVTLEYTGTCDENIISKEINVTPDLTISTEESMVYCEGDDVTLTFESDQSDLTAEWFDENGNSIGEGVEITYTPEGDQTVTVIATNLGGCSDTSSIFLDEYVFDLEVIVPEVACVGEDAVIAIIDNAGDNLSYVWQPTSAIVGSNTGNMITVNITTDTEFTVVVTNNDLGCTFTDNITLPVSIVSAEIVSNPEEVYQCNPAEISVVETNPNWTYQWNTGNTTPSFTSDTLLETTTFSVTVTDEFGCTATATKAVTVLLPFCDERDVFIPTAFTPNGDNINDVLRVESNFIKSMRLVIYNRWGQVVFESTNQDMGWDGTFDGVDLAPDAFAFSLQVTCSNQAEYSTQGNITLIR